MTDMRTTLAFKRIGLKHFTVKALLVVAAAMAVSAPSIQAADQQWWFDVEVIVFERHIEPTSILEQFEQASLAPPAGQLIDLLSPYIKPDLSYVRAGLPYCRASKRLALAKKYQQDFAFPVSKNNAEALPNTEPAEAISSPREIDTPAPINSTEPATDTFANEVASNDLFFTESDIDTLSSPTEPEATQRLETESMPQQARVHAPIAVEWIEWQMPSVFPCVYSEQVDPILTIASRDKQTETFLRSEPDTQAVPVEIDGIQWQQKRGPFLLPTDTFRMADLFSKIQKQPDITPILHLNWRQEVLFGHENAAEFRLFAGKNFAGQFAANGQVIVEDTAQLMTGLTSLSPDFYTPKQAPASESSLAPLDREQKHTQDALIAEQASEKLFAQIDAALADDSPVNFALPVNNTINAPETTAMLTKLEDIWQLDGGIKVYLQKVGRVPYLHIDSHLNYRHAIYNAALAPQSTEGLDSAMPLVGDAIAVLPQPNYLQSVTFDQLRRVISKQVHYFDHPLFGMIVRIHRYRWPEPDDTSEDGTEE